MHLRGFTKFLETVDLAGYRKKYQPIKIVEMDMPKNIQALDLLYKVYWDQKRFIPFDKFYQEYKATYSAPLEDFRNKTQMCEPCFYKGLPARIYRTWAGIITQIHAGYVAESVFGEKTVAMSAALDHSGADFQVAYKRKTLNYQVKKRSFNHYVTSLDEIRNKRLNLRRVSLTADLIKSHSARKDVSFSEIVQADLILYYLTELQGGRFSWFPRTSAYNSRGSGVEFFERLASRQHFKKTKDLFGVRTIDELKKSVAQYIEGTKNQEHRRSWSWDYEILPLEKVINQENIGVVN